jgi:hypothetical protein
MIDGSRSSSSSDRRNTAETLAEGAGHRGSPEGLPRRRGPAEATRKSTASSERVGSVGKGAGRQICTKAVEMLDSGLQKSIIPASLDQEKGRVR